MTKAYTHQESILQQRYGTQKAPDTLRWTKEIETILSHRSVRHFLQKDLPEGTLETLTAAAQSASTSSALNQWSLVAVTDSLVKKTLAEAIARTIPTTRLPLMEEAPALLLWIADASRSAEITAAMGDDPFVLSYLDSFLMASIDAALAAQNAAIAAESLGLGIVYLGMMRNAAQEVADIIGLPPYSMVVFGMALGVPDPDVMTEIRPRPAQAMVLHHNHYAQERYKKYVAGFEEASQTFRASQSMSEKTWTDAITESMTSMHYMGGREKLRLMVEQQGFKLR